MPEVEQPKLHRKEATRKIQSCATHKLATVSLQHEGVRAFKRGEAYGRDILIIIPSASLHFQLPLPLGSDHRASCGYRAVKGVNSGPRQLRASGSSPFLSWRPSSRSRQPNATQLLLN